MTPPTYHMAPGQPPPPVAAPAHVSVTPSAPPLEEEEEEEEEEEGPVVPAVDRTKKPSYSGLSTSFGGKVCLCLVPRPYSLTRETGWHT